MTEQEILLTTILGVLAGLGAWVIALLMAIHGRLENQIKQLAYISNLLDRIPVDYSKDKPGSVREAE